MKCSQVRLEDGLLVARPFSEAQWPKPTVGVAEHHT